MIYQPSEDSFLLKKFVESFSRDKNVLDMGAGSGIQAEIAKASGAKTVLAVDVNNECVEFCRGKKINAIRSNLFSKVKGKFDLIVFNPPYLPEDDLEDEKSALATTGGKNGDEIVLEFLKKAKHFLEGRGKILILISSLTPKEKMEKIIEKDYKKIILETRNFFMEKLEVWELRKR